MVFLSEVGFLRSNLLYFSFIFAFLVKVPLWGLHLWLPKAHVEAPVGGSMVLAGILLKLGGFGVVYVCFSVGGFGGLVVRVLVGIRLWGAFLVSVLILGVRDIKIIIAYSSVIHTNLTLLGFLRLQPVAFFGGLVIIIGHGFTSPGMFALVNVNYERTHSRNLILQKGFGSIKWL